MPGTRLVLLLLAATLTLGGCAGLQRKPPPTLDEVVEMSQRGTPAEDIVRELRENGAVYPLSGSQIAKLHEQGVPDEVLDYLQQSYVDSVRRYERWRYHDPFWNGPCFGCYYYSPWARPHLYFPY